MGRPKNTTTRRAAHHPFALPLPGFGERKMTPEDFELACEREGIRLVREPLKRNKGMCARLHGVPTIWIHSGLKGADKLFTEFHELAHYFLHDGRGELFRAPDASPENPAQEWAEVEASAAACLALAPDFPINFMFRLVSTKWRPGGGKGRR